MTSNMLNLDIPIKFIKQLSVAVLYLALGIIIHRYFTSQGIVSAIWPGSGLALAVLLIGGKHYVWGILSGSLLLNTLFLDSFWAIGGMTLAQTLEAFLGAWLLTRNSKSILFLHALPDYLRLIVLGAGVATISGAIIGALALFSAGIISPADYLANVLHWWMGDALGVVLVTPFILAFWQEKNITLDAKQLIIATLLITLTFIAGQIIFFGYFYENVSNVPRAYIMFFCVTWVSILLGIYGTTFVLLMIAIQALWGAYYEVGFFADEISTANLKNYWLFMLILSMVGMILAIYVNTIKRVNKETNILNQRFSDLVDSTDGIVWEADATTFNFTFVSKQAERLFGYPIEDWMKPGFWVKHIHPDDQVWAPTFCMSCTKQKEPHNFEYRFITHDGRTIWLRDIVNVVIENNAPRWIRGIMIDITEHKATEHDLRVAATAFEAKEGMMITDAAKVILRVNSAFTNITGYTAEDVYGKTPKILSSGLQDKNFYMAMWDAINSTGSWRGELYNKNKNGGIYPQSLSITSVKDKNNNIINYVATLADISTHKAAEEEIKNLAFYDHLTGLPNRRLLIDRLDHALASSTRSKQDGALLFIDMDNFKNLNDTLGHDFGDQLLKQVAKRLTSCVREADTVSRFGGDEFVVILEELSGNSIESATLVKNIANKILTSLCQTYQFDKHEHHSSSSIGIAVFNSHQHTTEELLKQADIAMYQAKKSGRNAVCFFDPKMQDVILDRSSLESELRKALDKKQFHLHYQIQVDDSNNPVGVEALIRWQHPERGLVSPIKFIPLAEETGLILPIGQWVIRTACSQIKRWQKNMRTCNLVLSVNVSIKQLRQTDFAEQVKSAIQQADIKPELLKLELTESMLLENVKDTITTMNKLKTIGVQFSLDDFGTGYSSLQYLKQLPLNQLKIDQSFVRDIVFDSNDRSIVSTIIAMAQNLGLSVIAEGVETEEQQEILMNQGCAVYQGYLFSKPLPIEKFEELLESRSDNS